MKKLFLTLVLMLTVSFASINAMLPHLNDKLFIKESFKLDVNKKGLYTTVEYEYVEI